MSGQDARGQAGFRSQVDRHNKRLIGFAVLTSLFAAASDLSTSRNRSLLSYPSRGEVFGSAVGREATELGAQVTRRNLNLQPTIKIPVGYKFNVRVNRDILFESFLRSRDVSVGRVGKAVSLQITGSLRPGGATVHHQIVLIVAAQDSRLRTISSISASM
jgi:hypothetical protein